MQQRTWTLRAAVVMTAALMTACSDGSITAPANAADATVSSAKPTAATAAVAGLRSLAWNKLARDLVTRRVIDPPMAARIYALLSVAQYDAIIAANRVAPGSARARHEATARAAVVAASAAVLEASFPLDGESVRSQATGDMAPLLASRDAGEARAAYAVGDAEARLVLARAITDGANMAWIGSVPTGDGLWYSAPAGTPLRPSWGSVRTWLLRSGHEFRPAPPPAWGSARYKAALGEVRHIADTRTAEQVRIALFWSDGSGTVTPPGHWNVIAADLIDRHQLSEQQAARTLALLNMALMDAGIACWDAKYHYWLIRPSQADKQIVTAVPLPNFPSYVSGHATFSGAAAELLSAAFPSERRALTAKAEEAAMSRLYGGIHYRFDNEQGLTLGHTIGRLAAARLHGDGSIEEQSGP